MVGVVDSDVTVVGEGVVDTWNGEDLAAGTSPPSLLVSSSKYSIANEVFPPIFKMMQAAPRGTNIFKIQLWREILIMIT